MARSLIPAACRTRLALIGAGMLLAAGPGHAQEGAWTDTYTDALSRSAAHQQEGDLAAAAADLEAVRPLYPQDLDLVLRLGWLRLRDHRCAAARVAFHLALALHPGDPSARDGLSLCPTVQGSVALGAVGSAFPNHPTLQAGLAAAASARLVLFDRWSLSATYRYRYFFPAYDGALSVYDQHEAFLSAGYGGPRFGLALHYAFLSASSGDAGPSHHLGVTARVSPWGDGVLALSASLYPDLTVLRGEASWRMPIRWGLGLRPGLAVQWSQGGATVAGLLEASLWQRWGGLFLGAKYGNEVRPAYLDLALINNLPQTIVYGLWAGLAVRMPGKTRLHLSYALDRLDPGDGSDLISAHAVSLGVAKEF